MKISEMFMSIQGEGATVGVPSYFIRLQNCNLMCGGSNGSLVKEGKATWWCDTEAQWKQGTEITNEEIIKKWKEQNILDDILSGQIHVIWTGGEPCLPRNAKDIINFMTLMENEYYYNDASYNELETNGTIITEPIVKSNYQNFYELFQQINCSPKLSNSGIKKEVRIVDEAILQITDHYNYWFKFVISSEKDIEEIEEDYIKPFHIDRKRVILMPDVDRQDEVIEKTRQLFEICKKYKYRGITRQHILVWGKKPGV